MNEIITKLEQLEKEAREYADDFCDRYEEGKADAYLEIIEMLKEIGK